MEHIVLWLALAEHALGVAAYAMVISHYRK